MKKNSWLEEFEFNTSSAKKEFQGNVNDYEVFKDKKLLDKFRDTII